MTLLSSPQDANIGDSTCFDLFHFIQFTDFVCSLIISNNVPSLCHKYILPSKKINAFLLLSNYISKKFKKIITY